MSGLTDAGLEIETFETLVAGVKAEYLSEQGASLDLGDETPDGVWINVTMDRLAALYELLEEVHNAGNPDAATGEPQDSVCALTGTLREPGRPSTTSSILAIGTVATAITAGSRVSDSSTASIWTTDELATLIAAPIWVASTAYTTGRVRSNAGRMYLSTIAGVSAGSGGPTTTDLDITDGTVQWRYLGDGLGVVGINATCTVDGPTLAVAYAIDTIDTPISGWATVVNLLDATPGALAETHEALRIRREVELAEQGASIPDAIRAEMLGDNGPAGVTHCTVFINRTDSTDEDGIPPHSVEVMVVGGDDQDIYDQLRLSVAGGIDTHGDQVGASVDSQGVSHVFRFRRPTEVLAHVIIEVEVDPDTYATGGDGETAVKAAVVAYGGTLGIGRDIRARPIGGAVQPRLSAIGEQLGVVGVIDTPSIKIGTAALPTLETTIAIGTREVAMYDTSRVTVVETEVTP